ncbi:zinc metalloproteinase-disintegrin-like batroxstatin-3 [Dendronephthya gigantea]|uniref:zinc metalloproteinase-disintegrin-like batroxstatin-3 n=1 Tax=Dendronephthya gigantea TaxID=151771 RepID=UPI00106AC688|nr:zinc metalloproteinase-disintegrin-like batroxstatin-3 [Dendronephthya gigantea]
MVVSSAVGAVFSFLLIVVLSFQTDAEFTDNLHRHKVDAVEMLRNLRLYEVIKPYRQEGQVKRDDWTNISFGTLQDAIIVFPGRKKHFVVDISLNKDLFARNFQEFHFSKDESAFEQKTPQVNCFYQGTVNGEENSAVSLSICNNGIEGVIRTDDGTFFIQPLKSHDGQISDEHAMFNAEDVDEKPRTCGHTSRMTQPKEEFNMKISTNWKKRFRRNVLSETKYVELFIINDKEQHRRYGENTGLRAKSLANHLDSIYRRRNIRVALVRVETWRDQDRITVDKNVSKTFNNFLSYTRKNVDKFKGKHFDNVQLISGVDFLGPSFGFAAINSICGSKSAAVVQDHSAHAALTASTMAHVLGHNLGMVHDSTDCECPDSDGECIMSSFSTKAATRFSSCSLLQLEDTLEKGYGTCLFNEPKKLFGDAICGNGFVEEGEECDCGTEEECDYFKNKCCNASSCMLLPGALCSHGECCEKDCKFSSRGKLCRETHDDCDLPEYCTGDTGMCPQDYHVQNGVNCSEHNGYCYGGVCRNIELQCQNIFGNGTTAGKEACFWRNSAGTRFHHCHNETHKYFACPKGDVRCGKIHCLSNRRNHLPKKGQDRGAFWISFDSKTYCITPLLTWGDGLDPTYVDDGTKCGEGKMCMKSRCVSVEEAIQISPQKNCTNNCSGNGVCNNNGNCHCNNGYACPDCKTRGSDLGGSIDSGQGCQTSSHKNQTYPSISTTQNNNPHAAGTRKDQDTAKTFVPIVLVVWLSYYT